jgi:hypothetical protein
MINNYFLFLSHNDIDSQNSSYTVCPSKAVNRRRNDENTRKSGKIQNSGTETGTGTGMGMGNSHPRYSPTLNFCRESDVTPNLVSVARDWGDPRQSKIERLKRIVALLHEGEQETAKTSIHVHRNAIALSELQNNSLLSYSQPSLTREISSIGSMVPHGKLGAEPTS